MNERGNAAHAAGQNRRRRSESTHAQNDLGFELLINRSAAGKTFGEPANETKDGRRINGRKSDGWQFFEPKLGAGGEREAVDLFFGNKQKHFVPALAQYFSDRNSGKEMSTRASTCDDRVHSVIVDLVL